MKPLVLLCAVCAVCSLVGCSTAPLSPTVSSHASITQSDRLLAFNFLRALYRPLASEYRIIIDSNAEESWRSIPLQQRRAELSTRLTALRAAPREVLRIGISSQADPAHRGYLTILFNRTNGRIQVMPGSTFPWDADLRIDVRHWPDGTRLVCLSCSWMGDMKDDIFHRRSGERIYRFAISWLPLV